MLGRARCFFHPQRAGRAGGAGTGVPAPSVGGHRGASSAPAGRDRGPRCRYGHADVRLGEGGAQMFLEFPSRIQSGEQDASGGACQELDITRGSFSALPRLQ